MSERKDIAMDSDFYKRHHLRNPSLVLFLILFTFGFYVLWWFYIISKDLGKLNNNAPSEERALYIFILIPATLYLVTFILSFSELPKVALLIIKNWGWMLVLFLVLKFLFDFCQSFGEFTKANGIYWFLGYFFACMGFVAIFFNNLYLAPLILIFPIIIPAMQAQFNFWIDRLNLKKKSDAFYF